MTRPTVIVDDVHVRYSIQVGARTRGAAGALRSLVTGKSNTKVTRHVHAVRGVTLVANEGDTIGLIGRNGSGKSSLLRAIAGLRRPESGTIYTSANANLLGVSAALNKAVSGNANITLGCLAMGMSRNQLEELRPWIIEFAGLEEFIDLPMGTYSSGMQSRLRFAIAASRQHEILLIDEALNTGDTEFRERSQAKVRELTSSAGTVFVVAHGAGMIREMCNRVIWLDKGQIQMDGATDEVLAAYEADIDKRRGNK